MSSLVSELFHCCRSGDEERVRLLVEERDLDPNIRDKWDSTPLYYACLCGHESLVQYLLSMGARCEPNTFDGERCVYGALTIAIRRILEQHAVLSGRLKRRHEFDEALRRLWSEREGADVRFLLADGARFEAHRFLLAARSDYFCRHLNNKWRQKMDVAISNAIVVSEAFGLHLEWLYTGHVRVHRSLVEDVELIASNCRLNRLSHDLQKSVKRSYELVMLKRGLSRISEFDVESESADSELKSDLWALAQCGLPADLSCPLLQLPLNNEQRLLLDTFFDLKFVIGPYHFFGHKAMYSVRSEYFRALLSDHFNEAVIHNNNNDNSDNLEKTMSELVLRDVRPEVFAVIHTHVYSDTQTLSPELVLDVLATADMFLLSGLKKQCGNFIGQLLTADNAVHSLNTARLFGLERLERAVYHFMAANIEEMVDESEFRAQVIRDASCVQYREETDSIDIVDEIRFCIKTTNDSIEQVQQKLQTLDDALLQMGFSV